VRCEQTAERVKQARRVAKGIVALRVASVATPLITDNIARWLPPRAVPATDGSVRRMCVRHHNGGLLRQPGTASVAYSLMVQCALYRWLIEQRYVLANPFSGVKVKNTERAALDASHAFAEAEWQLLRTIADGLEWSYGWKPAAAQRLRFVLDFRYATGLRASELVNVTLKDIRTDAQGDHWVELVGKTIEANAKTPASSLTSLAFAEKKDFDAVRNSCRLLLLKYPPVSRIEHASMPSQAGKIAVQNATNLDRKVRLAPLSN
jgi:integrase